MMKRICSASALALAVLASGCATRVVYTPAPPPPSPVVVQSVPPAPPPTAPAGDDKSIQAAAPQPAPAVVTPPPPPAAPPVGYVPDYYVWDGYEYVGVYGDQYVYWTGGTWVVCDPIIVARFHGWEHYHPGWRRGGVHLYYRGRGHWR